MAAQTSAGSRSEPPCSSRWVADTSQDDGTRSPARTSRAASRADHQTSRGRSSSSTRRTGSTPSPGHGTSVSPNASPTPSGDQATPTGDPGPAPAARRSSTAGMGLILPVGEDRGFRSPYAGQGCESRRPDDEQTTREGAAPMQYRTIGQQTVSAIGLGGMPMSIEGRPDRARSVAAVHAAWTPA